MQKHTKIYFDYYKIDYDPVSGWHDWIKCELPSCFSGTQDVHHLNGRGPGKDVIENLMGLCRLHHDKCNSNELPKSKLIEIHLKNL